MVEHALQVAFLGRDDGVGFGIAELVAIGALAGEDTFDLDDGAVFLPEAGSAGRRLQQGRTCVCLECIGALVLDTYANSGSTANRH
jgi:hypothetical protein